MGIDPEAMGTLINMGFEEQSCRQALDVCNNDVNRAVEFLFSGPAADQEVVDMTLSPTTNKGESVEPIEWMTVQQRYKESRSILFSDSATALEKALAALQEHSPHVQLEGIGSVEALPSLPATLVFVNEFLPIMINIICVDPGCWLGQRNYATQQAEVARDVLRILRAAVQLVHHRFAEDDFLFCKELAALVSKSNCWYTGKGNERGCGEDREKILETVLENRTMELAVERLHSLLEPTISSTSQGQVTDLLQDACKVLQCVFAAPDLLQKARLEARAEEYFRSFFLVLEDTPLPLLRRAELAASLLSRTCRQLDDEAAQEAVHRIVDWILRCDENVAGSIGHGEVEEMFRHLENAMGQMDPKLYSCWLHVASICWRSPSLSRHLFALQWLARLAEECIGATRTEYGRPEIGKKYELEINNRVVEFKVLLDREDGTYDVEYTNTGEIEEGRQVTFRPSVSREVLNCALTHRDFVLWVRSHHLVEELFGTKRHQQLLTADKTKTLLIFLAKHEGLQNLQLDAMLRAACTAHDTERVEILSLLASNQGILQHLRPPLQGELLRRAAELLPADTLATLLTQNNAHWWCRSLKEPEARHTLLSILWTLSVDGSAAPDTASLTSPRSPAGRSVCVAQGTPLSTVLAESVIGTPMSTSALETEGEDAPTPFSGASTISMDDVDAAARVVATPCSPPSRMRLVSHRGGAGATEGGLPLGKLGKLFAQMMDWPEQQRYLEACLQHLREGSVAPVPPAMDVGVALEGVACVRLRRTERVLEVLQHILQATYASPGATRGGARRSSSQGRGPWADSPSSRGWGQRRRSGGGEPGDSGESLQGGHESEDMGENDSPMCPGYRRGLRVYDAPGSSLSDAMPGASPNKMLEGSTVGSGPLEVCTELMQLVLSEMPRWLALTPSCSLPKEAAVRQHLKFLSFLMSLASLQLTPPQLDLLWDLLQEGPEREALLTWLDKDASGSLANAPVALEHIFEHLLCPALEAPTATPTAFSCFRHYFIICNTAEGHLHSQPTRLPNRLSIETVSDISKLYGMGALWKAVLQGPEEVSKLAVNLLYHLHSLYQPAHTSAPHLGHRLLIQPVFELLKGYPVVLEGEELDSAEDLKYVRALCVLERILLSDPHRRLRPHGDIASGQPFRLGLQVAPGLKSRRHTNAGSSGAAAPAQQPEGVWVHTKLPLSSLRERLAQRVKALPEVAPASSPSSWPAADAAGTSWLGGDSLAIVPHNPRGKDSRREGSGSWEGERMQDSATVPRGAGTAQAGLPEEAERDVLAEELRIEVMRGGEGTEVGALAAATSAESSGQRGVVAMHIVTLEQAGLTAEDTLRISLPSGSGMAYGTCAPLDGTDAELVSVGDSLAECDLEGFFNMLEGGSLGLVTKAWRVLQLLPTSAQLDREVREGGLKWHALLAASSHKLPGTARAVYSLLIAAAILEEEPEARGTEGGADGGALAGARQWCRGFVSAGGFQAVHRYMVDLLERGAGGAGKGGAQAPPAEHSQGMLPELQTAALSLSLRVLHLTARRSLEADKALRSNGDGMAAVGAPSNGAALITGGSLEALGLASLAKDLLQAITLLSNAPLRPGAAAEAAEAESSPVRRQEDELLMSALTCLDTVMQGAETLRQPAVLEVVGKTAGMQALLSVLLRSPFVAARVRVRGLLRGLPLSLPRCYEPQAAAVKRSGMVVKLVALLVQELRRVDARSRTCQQYFELLCQMLGVPEAQELLREASLEDVLETLLSQVQRAPCRAGQPQEALEGALETCTVLLATVPHRVREALEGGSCGISSHQLVTLLLDECLFGGPRTKGGCTGGGSPDTLPRRSDPDEVLRQPKCSSRGARRAARRLLEGLVRQSPRLLPGVIGALDRLHRECPELPPAAEGGANPAVEPGWRNGTGLCGLVNQGATCYQNSILQQLYMIPDLRRGLMAVRAADDGGGGTPDPAQRSRLGEDATAAGGGTSGGVAGARVQRYHDPRALVQACEGTLRLAHAVHLQNDAQEFVDQLMSVLEVQLKDTSHEHLLRQCFGGVLSHQCTARLPGNAADGDGAAGDAKRLKRPVVEEPFLFLELAVKGKEKLQESLCDFVRVEQVDGLHWEHQGRQVDGLHWEHQGRQVALQSMKRTCLGTLPACLLFNLKRYEFDLQTMTRDKVNDHYEFPLVIDMWPYTKEGLEAHGLPQRGMEKEIGAGGHSALSTPTPAAREGSERSSGRAGRAEGGGGAAGSGQAAPTAGRAEYQYHLRGVVVQSGTERSGHYYSFIQDRASGEWFKFNDQSITPFDVSQLGQECFGGTEKYQLKRRDGLGQPLGPRREETKERARTRSAYMLVYERAARTETGTTEQSPAPSSPATPRGRGRADIEPSTASNIGGAGPREGECRARRVEGGAKGNADPRDNPGEASWRDGDGDVKMPHVGGAARHGTGRGGGSTRAERDAGAVHAAGGREGIHKEGVHLQQGGIKGEAGVAAGKQVGEGSAQRGEERGWDPGEERVLEANAGFLRAAHVYDLQHVELVRALVSMAAEGGAADMQLTGASATMATYFFQSILGRYQARTEVDLGQWLEPVRVLFTRARFGVQLGMQYLKTLEKPVLRAFLLECADAQVRQAFSDLVSHAAIQIVDQSATVVEEEPQRLLEGHAEVLRVAEMAVQLLEDVPLPAHQLRSTQLFQLLSRLAAAPIIGSKMLRADAAATLATFFVGSAPSWAAGDSHGGTYPYAGYEHLLAAIQHLLFPVHGDFGEAVTETFGEVEPGGAVVYCSQGDEELESVGDRFGAEHVLAADRKLYGSSLLLEEIPLRTRQAVLLNVPFLLRVALQGGSEWGAAERLCCAACHDEPGVSLALVRDLVKSIGDSSTTQAATAMLITLLALVDSVQHRRVMGALGDPVGGMLQQARLAADASSVARCSRYIHSLLQLQRGSVAGVWLMQHRAVWGWMVEWWEKNNAAVAGGIVGQCAKVSQPRPQSSPGGSAGAGGREEMESETSQGKDLQRLRMLRKRAYEEAGESMPLEETSPMRGPQTLEEEVAKQLKEMGYPNQVELARQAMRNVTNSDSWDQNTLNDAVDWVVRTYSCGETDVVPEAASPTTSGAQPGSPSDPMHSFGHQPSSPARLNMQEMESEMIAESHVEDGECSIDGGS
ncbi:hypothetical protein CYMTET_24645 [Cymbomonas tetramitiformis]|uniref:Ubiquitinyl hydrolase 1 n=1 Tax=Cymbomonas tetramitiformis TaxID=36881 RepID=A0AAE0FVH0_9CHLO|nr:hypothetical protein CYMTET_24645 [Cymbomonas tetramitiformis]